MANVLIPKKSTQAAKVPTSQDLSLGEIAINHADAKLYARHPVSGTVQQIGGGEVTIDTSLADLLTSTSGTLSADDPGADRLFFWDDSAGRATHLTVGTGLSISGTTLTATGTSANTASAIVARDASGNFAAGTITSVGLVATNEIQLPSAAPASPSAGDIYRVSDTLRFRDSGNAERTVAAGSTGTVDNAILRADVGTGIVQNSGLIVEDAIVSFTSITGDALTDVITATGSAFTDGQPVRFTALTGGTGLNTTTNYFVRESSGATFKVETSIGGGAINFTTNITAGTLLTGHSVSTNVTLSENTTATNSDLVLTPKGTGALIAQKPNGATSGGNARGANAVDFQFLRSDPSEVASGPNSFVAGTRNTAGGSASFAMGNQSAAWASDAACIGSFLISSGTSSFTTGDRNQATANFSACLGGRGAVADRLGMGAHAIGSFTSSAGTAQRARFVLRCKTTPANATVEMALDGSTTYLTIPSGKVMFMNIKVVGTKSDGTAVATYERQYAVKNVAGTSSEVYAPITIGTDNAAGTTLEVATVDAGDYVRIRPTGIASETWRWVASVDAVEVAYGT